MEIGTGAGARYPTGGRRNGLYAVVDDRLADGDRFAGVGCEIKSGAGIKEKVVTASEAAAGIVRGGVLRCVAIAGEGESGLAIRAA